MIARFCLYTTLRNLRFFEPFFVLYLLLGVDLSYLAIGTLLAYEKVLVGMLEVPLGVVTDRWGRRRALMVMFALAAGAFAVFAIASSFRNPLAWLYLAQTLYAVSEALRTGTHKAVMLDWLDGQGRRKESTRVVALTRIFSKCSWGVAAFAAGVIVYLSDSFEWLFWAAAIPSAAGVVLIWTYPRELEGEWSRQKKATTKREPWWPRARRLLSAPGAAALVVTSVIFETQVKLCAVYLQPYLYHGAKQHDLAVVGGLGAVAIGSYYLVQGLFAGGSSALASPWERRMGSSMAALSMAQWIGALGLALIAACLWWGVLWPGLIGLLALACLQNARRPIFISGLNEVMDPYQRATTLSVESQGRSWTYAALVVATGALADWGGGRWGLALVFTMLAIIMTLGVVPMLLGPLRVVPDKSH